MGHLYAVDDVAQTFGADLVLRTGWTDARLGPGLASDGPGTYCTYPVADVWTPATLILHERAITVASGRVVEVRAGGSAASPSASPAASPSGAT